MPSTPRKPKFTEPRYFDYLSDSKRWRCNACSPSPMLAQRNSMSTQAALKHEKTSEHKENVRAREEWNPPQDVDAWINGTDGLFESRVIERMQHVDQLKDFIPFWRRTIEAADNGETLRFEDFLNALQKKDEEEVVWNVPMPDWALEPLEPFNVEQRSIGTGHAQPSLSKHGLDREAFDFVEKVARMNSVNSERKERLHSFYKIPTNEKLERIQELINALRVTRGSS